MTDGKDPGGNICLHPIYLYGFVLCNINSNVKHKLWGEGNNPGNKIEFYLQGACTKIMIFLDLRVVNMVMVRVEIDDVVLVNNKLDLSDGVLYSWFTGI